MRSMRSMRGGFIIVSPRDCDRDRDRARDRERGRRRRSLNRWQLVWVRTFVCIYMLLV